VYFHNTEGLWSSVPASWTTVVREDPFVAMAQGWCLFRYEDELGVIFRVDRTLVVRLRFPEYNTAWKKAALGVKRQHVRSMSAAYWR
jgi:hypothetical protein